MLLVAYMDYVPAEQNLLTRLVKAVNLNELNKFTKTMMQNVSIQMKL